MCEYEDASYHSVGNDLWNVATDRTTAIHHRTTPGVSA